MRFCCTTSHPASVSPRTSYRTGRIRTVSKGFLWPSVNGGGVYINDARVIAADIDVSNGVIHVIDRVLLPA